MTAFEEAKRELLAQRAARRQAAEDAAEARRAALIRQDERFAAICEEKESYCEKILSAMQGTPEQAKERIAALGREHEQLREREANLLKELGLRVDYLKPDYRCKNCADRGYLENNELCECLKGDLNRLRARESGLFSLFEKQTFERFDPARGGEARELLSDNLQHCRRYAESFDTATSSNLLLCGGTGVGKTHLSSAIGRVVLEKGYGVIYEGAMEAVSALEMERFSESKPQSMRLLEADLLILDDLGTELPGKSGVSFLYYLINTRLIHHRPTIISTNLSAAEMEARYEQRLFSRLTGEFEILLFEGTDQRGREE